MSIERIAGYIRGYVVFCAEGFFCERFLNICMRRGIFLWNVRKIGSCRMCACIGISDFHQLREIARKTRTKVSITKRSGLPFLFHRYRKRRAALVGVLLFLALLWYLTTHIMGIDIVGNERVATESLLSGLKEFGLYHGASVRKIDDKLIKNQMMTEFDEIAWIGVNIKGSRAYIEVKERLDTKVALDGDVPCDIVASRDGLIKLLEVKEGLTVVKPNQLVEKGDLLVSGVIDSEKQGMRYVHSFGEVFAETSYKKVREYPFEYIEKIYTGQKKNRYRFSVLGKEFRLFLKQSQPFEYCDKEDENREYKAPFSFVPSLFVQKESFSEYVPEKKSRNLEETLKLAGEELSAEIEKEIPPKAEVLDKSVTYTELGKKGISVTVEVRCREDIATQRIIDKIEVLGYDVK